MTRTKNRNKQGPGMHSGNVQHIVQGGDIVAVASTRAPESTSMTANNSPLARAGMNHRSDRELREDLRRQNKDLNKKYKALQAERKDLDLEREAIAFLASQDPSNPEVTRRSTLLRLRCEGLEVRDRVLARERSTINFGLHNLGRNGSQHHAKQQHGPKKGKGKRKQITSEGAPHNKGILSWDNSWDNDYFEDENKIMNPSDLPESGIEKPQVKLEEGEIEECPEQQSSDAPSNQASPYDYTSNASAMLADLGGTFSAHKGIHPQRLLNLAAQSGNNHTPQENLRQAPKPCGTSSNNVPLGQKSRLDLSSSFITPRPASDAGTVLNSNMSPLPTESGFSFFSNMVHPKAETGSTLAERCLQSLSGPYNDMGIQQPGQKSSHGSLYPKFREVLQGRVSNVSPEASAQQPEISISRPLMQAEDAVKNIYGSQLSPKHHLEEDGQPLMVPSNNEYLPPKSSLDKADAQVRESLPE